ncbi:DUF4349 domain-containing protein [Actinokineospora auranticolor]|uniref:DUF4349 domain-containing protein n=1 Tax=Actinokineospora auranticolor TaxID=155976 RepID=UPI001FE6C5A5|nr:DUF4349 domain-containing protein [Actinokineospora auranticolor]
MAPQPADSAAGGRGDSGAESNSSSGAAGGAKAPQAAQPTEPDQRPQVPQPGVDRKLVRTALIEMTAPNVPDAAAQARAEAVAAGGYSGQEQVDDRRATLTLYVPSDQLDKALPLIEKAGKVRSRSQTAQDVTEQVVDVESRIATQRTSLSRVRALLDRATAISEIVQLESEVTRREADLESLLKRREALAGSVAMSTVSVRIAADGAPPVASPKEDDTLLGAFGDGWSAFVDTVAVIVFGVARVLPFALVVAVPACLVWRSRRRRRGADTGSRPPLPPVVAPPAPTPSEG